MSGSRAGGEAPVRRIFIDSTFVHFEGVRSGVPRVASAYVREGLRLARAFGVEIAAVIYDLDAWYIHDRVPKSWRAPAGQREPFRPLGPMRLLGRTALGMRDRGGGPAGPAPAGQPAAGGHEARSRLRRLLKADLRVRWRPGDLLFSPAFWHDLPAEAFAEPAREGVRTAVLVHDILPLTLPEAYDRAWRETFGARLLAMAREADHLFAISRTTADSMSDWLEPHGIRRPITVALNGLDAAPPAPPAAPNVASKAEFLMVGSIEPKKNHLYVLDELGDRLDRQRGDATLTIVGRAGWLDEPIVAAMRRMRASRDIDWRTDCTDDDLQGLYARCGALIQASHAEGFGLPVIEAAAAGCPIIASDIAAIRETAPDGTLFFPLRPGALRDATAGLDAAAFADWRARTPPRPWRPWSETVAEVLARLTSA